MTPGWFSLVVLAAGMLAGASGAIAFQLLFCLFGATAALELTALGGAPVLPAVAFLPFLVLRAWSERARAAVRRWPTAGTWLLLTIGWAVLSAIVLPRLLGGTVAVKTYDRGGRDDAITVLLRPVSGNVTQSGYAILDGAVFFAMRSLLVRTGRMETFARAVLVLAAANCLAAVIGLAEYYAGLPRMLEALRSAKYTVYETYELGGVARVQGTFSEAAVFSMFTMPLFAFTSELWLRRAFCPHSGYVALASLLLLLVSTSATAYVALAGYAMLSSLAMFWQFVTKGAAPRLRSLCVGGAALVALACLVGLWAPELLSRIAAFLDATVARKLTSASGLDRSAANRLAWTDFLETYGAGVGLGSTRASSFVLVVLSNLGAVGACLFVAFVVAVCRSPEGDDSIEAIVARAARAAVLSGLIAASLVSTVFDLGIAFYCLAAAATVTLRDVEARDTPVRAAAPEVSWA